jgi:hypothetical protein
VVALEKFQALFSHRVHDFVARIVAEFQADFFESEIYFEKNPLKTVKFKSF